MKRKKVIKIRANINKTEKMNKIKSWFFCKLKEIGKHLPRLRRKERRYK